MRPTATYVFRTIPTILTTRQNPREACASRLAELLDSGLPDEGAVSRVLLG